MRNRTPVPFHHALLLGLALGLCSSSATLASPCDREISWLLNSHETLTPDPGERIVQRALELPSAGVLILEASNPSRDEGRPWIDVRASLCHLNEAGFESDRIPQILYRQLDRNIIEVAGPAVIYLEAGWVDRAHWGSPLEIMAQFTPTLLAADDWGDNPRLVYQAASDGESEDDEDGDGTGELDNEILPNGGDEEDDEDGDGTGELDNEILPNSDPEGTLLRDAAIFGILGQNTVAGSDLWSLVLESPRRVLLELQAENAAVVRIFDGPRREIHAFEVQPGRLFRGEILLPSGAYLLRLESMEEKVTPYSLEVSSLLTP